MRDGLGHLFEQTFLGFLIGRQTKCACGLETQIALPVRITELRRQARQREALLNMP
jgi:hypothetical protein